MSIFSHKTTYALEISNHKVALLRLGKDGLIEQFASQDIPSGIIEGGKIIDISALAGIVREVATKVSPAPEHLAISIPEGDSFVHIFSLDKNISDQEIEKTITDQAKNIIPLEVRELYQDHLNIAESTDATQKILYVGARRQAVDAYTAVVAEAKMSIVFIDTESLSMGRALFSPTVQQEVKAGDILPATMVVNIGKDTTGVSIFNHNGAIALSSSIPFSGGKFTKTLADELQIKIDRIEDLANAFHLDPTKSDDHAKSVLESVLSHVAQEIRRACDYYEIKYPQEKITKIILAGISVLIPNINTYIGSIVQRPVTIGDPQQVVSNSTQIIGQHAILFSNLIGLGMRIHTDEKGINIMKGIEKTKKLSIQEQPLATDQENKVLSPGVSPLVKKILTGMFILVAFGLFGFIVYKYVYVPSYPKTVEQSEVVIPEDIRLSPREEVDLLIQDNEAGEQEISTD